MKKGSFGDPFFVCKLDAVYARSCGRPGRSVRLCCKELRPLVCCGSLGGVAHLFNSCLLVVWFVETKQHRLSAKCTSTINEQPVTCITKNRIGQKGPLG